VSLGSAQGDKNRDRQKNTKELKKQLEEKNIELYVERSGKAVEIFNSVDKNKKVIGAFHLTC
jgi:hypothetical protein